MCIGKCKRHYRAEKEYLVTSLLAVGVILGLVFANAFVLSLFK